MFSKAHYELLADYWREQLLLCDPSEISLIVHLMWNMANKLKLNNANFNSEEFFNYALWKEAINGR